MKALTLKNQNYTIKLDNEIVELIEEALSLEDRKKQCENFSSRHDYLQKQVDAVYSDIAWNIAFEFRRLYQK